MLTNICMEENGGLLRFPEKLKEPFLGTGDISLWDGRRVSPGEMWEFLTKEAPRYFPFFFTANRSASNRLPYQIELLSNLKFYYLWLTRRFRVEAMRKAGWVLTLVNGGPQVDLYFGARAIPLRPGPMATLMMSYVAEGKGVSEHASILEGIHDDGVSRADSGVCRQMRTHSGIRRRLIPVDLLAPYTAMRCSDMAYLVEWQRGDRPDLPKRLVDYPWNHDPSKPWKVRYVTENLREAVKTIDQLTTKNTTDDNLRAACKQMNRVRRASRNLLRLWWSAPVEPTASKLVCDWGNSGCDALCDPTAMAQVLEGIYEELKERIEHGMRGAEVSARPARLWVCGSCVEPSPFAIDERGGILLGRDDRWSALLVDVEEEGDPYENIARALMLAPYEQVAKKRALWAVDEARKARADGILFAFHWGCNYQAAISRLMCDVAKEAGLPAIQLEQDDLGRATTPEQSLNRISAFIEMLGGVALTT